jgi:hypothetical protein
MPWSEWEDYRGGMYGTEMNLTRLDQSAALLRDPERFRETAREMLREWPNAARHNLIHMWSGRRAWIGQASCCYSHRATSVTTRHAWGTLTNDEQRAANAVADEVHAEWERGWHDAQTALDV